MKTIGLIGEDSCDKKSIEYLLSKKYPKGLKFKNLLDSLKGTQIQNKKFYRLLKGIGAIEDFDLIIFIRDLDSHKSDIEKKNAIIYWFENCCKHCNSNTILLLNVQEIESLILADIETFNSLYKSSLVVKKNPEEIPNPKEFLIRQTRSNPHQYKPSENPHIFKHLNIHKIESNVDTFKEFIREFEIKLYKENH